MAKIVSDDIQQIKKEIADLRREVERAHAVTACENLMNKYQYYHMRGMRTEETHLFALKSPGACVEMLWGIYDEPEGVLRWKRFEGYGRPKTLAIVGGLWMHGMCTPIIEVAKDGKTARGLWMMIGSETMIREGNEAIVPQGTDAVANWGFGQFAMDFIKEDGEWKIWKYNTTGLVMCPYDKGWAIANMPLTGEGVTRPDVTDEYKPDRPASYPYMWSRTR